MIMVVGALVGLAANLIDAVDRGASTWNVIAILGLAVVLFAGTAVIARPE
jgi:hypothetical protein